MQNSPLPALELFEQGLVELHERLARLRVLPAGGAGREAHEPHESRGLRALAAHVPDDGLPAAVVHLEEVVEVSPRLEHVARGKVAGRDVDPRDPGKRLRQQTFLERARDVVPFPIQPRIVDGDGRAARQVLTEMEVVFGVVLPGLRPHHRQGPEGPPSRDQRDGHDGAQLEALDDLQQLRVGDVGRIDQLLRDLGDHLGHSGSDDVRDPGGVIGVTGESLPQLVRPLDLGRIDVCQGDQ